MKFRVAYKSDGRIVTAVPLEHENSTPALRIAEKAGVDVAEFDVSTEFEEKKFHEFLHLLRVDRVTKRLVRR
jgi:hypothetical protein